MSELDSQQDPKEVERLLEASERDPSLLLLKSALGEAPRPPRSLLPKIQDRIHLRTRGRYFKTRYSRSLDPIPLLLVAALLVLLLAAAVYLVLQPLTGAPQPHLLPHAPSDPLAVPRQ